MQTKILLFVLSFSLCLLSCKKDDRTNNNQTTPSTLNQDLVLYMPFNSSLADSSSSPSTVTAFGSVSYGNNRYFEAGKALVLNGTNSRIELTSPKFDTLSRFTIYMEFRPTNANPMVLLSRTQFAVTAKMNQSFSLMTNFEGGGTRFQIKKAGSCDNETIAAFGPSVLGSALPSINAWNYVAVTVEGNTISTYLNGTLVGTGTQPGATICAGAPLIIGSWWEGDARYFAGQVDELRLYKRVLSKEEITQLHQLHK